MENINHLPEVFLKRVKQILGANFDKYISDISVRRPVQMRTNTIKSDKFNTITFLKENKINFIQVNWYDDAYILPEISVGELMKFREYDDGLFYIQNLSSMIPSLVLNPQKCEKILDITAAPGSKATQIAAIMKNSGEIIANDLSKIRLEKLKSIINKTNVKNIKTVNMPAQKIWQLYPEYFDKTLVDVPCSLEGKIQLFKDSSYANWSLSKVKKMRKTQEWILRSAISATKPGGVIVYSTCTLSPEENEEVIDWIIQKENNNLEVENIKLDNFKFSEPIMKWKNKSFNKIINRTARIIPDEIYEGFFIAKLRKLKSNVMKVDS